MYPAFDPKCRVPRVCTSYKLLHCSVRPLYSLNWLLCKNKLITKKKYFYFSLDPVNRLLVFRPRSMDSTWGQAFKLITFLSRRLKSVLSMKKTKCPISLCFDRLTFEHFVVTGELKPTNTSSVRHLWSLTCCKVSVIGPDAITIIRLRETPTTASFRSNGWTYLKPCLFSMNSTSVSYWT